MELCFRISLKVFVGFIFLLLNFYCYVAEGSFALEFLLKSSLALFSCFSIFIATLPKGALL